MIILATLGFSELYIASLVFWSNWVLVDTDLYNHGWFGLSVGIWDSWISLGFQVSHLCRFCCEPKNTAKTAHHLRHVFSFYGIFQVPFFYHLLPFIFLGPFLRSEHREEALASETGYQAIRPEGRIVPFDVWESI